MTFLLSVAVPCMETTILRVLRRGCSERRCACDSDPLTESFPRSQLGVAPSKQNVAVHRLAGFAQNWPQVKSRKTTSQERSSLAFHIRPVLCSSVTPCLQSVASLVCLIQKTNCIRMMGACHLDGLLTVSAARLPSSENTSASCFLPTCRIVCSSTTRKLTVARCFHIMVFRLLSVPLSCLATTESTSTLNVILTQKMCQRP